jgi:pyruvate dehydrogenase E2 component (dihydrolipoamide acetyltransferase)
MTLVEVPKLGNTVEECIVGEWRKREGDRVTEGEVIAEIETDKTTFEITAPVSGTILEVFFEQGALAPVFAKLCSIGEAGESAAPAPPEVDTFLSPRAKRFAAEHDFVPPPITGSGPGGRVIEQDVRQAVEAAPAKAPAPLAERTSSVRETGAERTSNVREKIAQRLRESLSTTAQYTLHTSAGASRLLSLRARCKATAALAGVTIGDMIHFCVIQALLDVPALNAEYVDGSIRRHSEVHLGFACDTERGLLVPVIRNSHKMTLAELSSAVVRLAKQANEGTLPADDMRGATFTVSNLGGLGIEAFTPILTPPQVAILGVGAIQLKAVRKGGGIEFADSIGLSLTCDHQVIDGAPGARFLKVLAQKIEQVDSLCSMGA